MFDGFELTTVDTGEAAIRVRRGGSGPPLLLLHGHPQTHVMWHLLAPRLARDFTVGTLAGVGAARRPAEPLEVGQAQPAAGERRAPRPGVAAQAVQQQV